MGRTDTRISLLPLGYLWGRVPKAETNLEALPQLPLRLSCRTLWGVLAWPTGKWKTSLSYPRQGLTGVPNKLTSRKLLGVLMRFRELPKHSEKLPSGLLVEFAGKLPVRMPLKAVGVLWNSLRGEHFWVFHMPLITVCCRARNKTH